MSPRSKRKPLSAWHYWQQAERSLEAIRAEMQKVAACITEEPPIAIPSYAVAAIRRDLERLQTQFLLMAFEQKRKAAAR
jgi:ubiquinone biosynthesis protein UbiJ